MRWGKILWDFVTNSSGHPVGHPCLSVHENVFLFSAVIVGKLI
jgi:hypothetical protein